MSSIAQQNRLKGFNASLTKRGVSVTLHTNGDTDAAINRLALIEPVTMKLREQLHIADEQITHIVHILRTDLHNDNNVLANATQELTWVAGLLSTYISALIPIGHEIILSGGGFTGHFTVLENNIGGASQAPFDVSLQPLNLPGDSPVGSAYPPATSLTDANLMFDRKTVTEIDRADSAHTYRVQNFTDDAQRPAVMFHCILA